MELNRITLGDFAGQYMDVMGSFVFIRKKMFAKEKRRYPIIDYVVEGSKTEGGGVAPIWLGMAFGGPFGGLLGAAVSGKTHVYTRVKIKYNDDEKERQSTVILGEQEYQKLREHNKNARPLMTIMIKIDK